MLLASTAISLCLSTHRAAAANGAPGFTGPAIQNTAPLQGGDGDSGVPSAAQGGDGGAAALLTGAGPSSNTSSMQGGAGGAGGTVDAAGTSIGQFGGVGGSGAEFSAAGVQFTNSGRISGGIAGTGGAAHAAASGGVANSLGGSGNPGGLGVLFSNATAGVINFGAVTGGDGGAGAAAGDASGISSANSLGGNAGAAGVAAKFTGVNASLTNSGSLTGGTGGAGGAGANADTVLGTAASLGSAGASGGFGAIFTGAGANVSNTGSVTGGNGGTGGAAGTATAGASGAAEANGGTGGRGEIGALFAAASATVVNSGALTGGNGGAGGAGGSASLAGTLLSMGGNGGAGAAGAGSIGANTTFVNASSGVVTGGNGGSGGAAGTINGSSAGAVAGSGGLGGDGLLLFGGGNSTLTNNGTVRGGNGGLGASGGTGVSGQDLVITNAGLIAGGLSGDGLTRAAAIDFFSGTNRLELQAGSTIIGGVIGGGTDTLRLGGSANASFDAALIGTQFQSFEFFEKTGSSTWTLTGSNAAAISWAINGGTLNVAGTLANTAMAVNSGATLAGTGTIGSASINAGGTFAPTGAMTIAGNLAFQSGAVYLVQLGTTAVNVFGSATLAGSVSVPFGGSLQHSQNILHAAGGFGGTQFDALTTGNSNFAATLSYTATDVVMTVNAATLGGGTSLNVNQQNVANAINAFFNNGGTLGPGFGTLFGLTGASLANALSQLSGEIGSAPQQATFSAVNAFMGALADPFAPGRDDPFGGASSFAGEPLAYAASGKPRGQAERDAYAAVSNKAPPRPASFEARWSVWGAGFGGSQKTSGNALVGSNDTSSSLSGGTVGADYRISADTIAGFALSGGGTNFRVDNFGSGRSDLFQVGAFVKHAVGPAYLVGALAYGWNDVTTDRVVTVAGLDHLRARFDANTWSGRVESGYRLPVQGIGLTPYAAGQFINFGLPAYTEQAVVGTNAFALTYNAKNVTDVRSELGMRAEKSFATPNGILTLRGRAAWVHDFNPDPSIAATFVTLPGASFVVNGAAMASDWALASASAELKWIGGWSMAAIASGEFSRNTQTYSGRGVLRYAW